MECDICQLKWSTENIIPLILPCGHTFCQSCLILNLPSSNKPFQCPTCKKELNSLKTKDDILNLKKNSALLSLIDKVQTYKTNNISNISMSSQNLNFSHINNNQDANNSRILQNNNDILFEEDLCKNKNGEFCFPICQVHKNKANFYNYSEDENIKKKNFYCDECLQTNVLENLKPLPFLKSQNEFKLNSCKNKIKLLRNEIIRVGNFLKSYQKNFEKNNEKKIEELFDFINKIIQYNYTIAKTLFQQCQREQKNQIDKKNSELLFLQKELDSFEKKLDSIIKTNSECPDPEQQITLDNVYNKISNYINYENELNLFQINISIKEEDKDALFNTIQAMCQLDVDFLKMKNGELPTIKELLNKNSTWPCDCGVLDNSLGKIICKGCSKYRPLETYSNLVFNPLLAEKSEIKEFNMRRKHEEKVFQSLKDRNMDNLKHAYFFAIDITWYNKWQSFIYNDDKSSKFLDNYKKYISDNKKIGVLPPGIIDNSSICEINRDNKENKRGMYILKKGLKENIDYVVVNQYLWEWYLLNYGGGPEIHLKENDYLNLNKNNIFDNENQSIMILEDNPKVNENIGLNSNLLNKHEKENKEKEINKSNDEHNEKRRKYKIELDNNDDEEIFERLYKPKLTEIKTVKQKKIENTAGPEIKKKLFKSLISNINI